MSNVHAVKLKILPIELTDICDICVLSYDQRVTVVIRYLRKHWYTVSGVIT